MHLFLDSGAFSVYNLGTEIDIDEYIKYVGEWGDKITHYATLDVIGDPHATYKNWEYMRAAGLNPMPVYHAPTEEKYLKKYIEDSEYLALGDIAKLSRKARSRFLDNVWKEYLVPSGVKVHGFGLTSYPLLARYPWYSVDSTKWFRDGIYGRILIPYRRDGEWKYDRPPWQATVTPRSGQITTLSPTLRKLVEQYIEEQGFKIGKTKIEKIGGKRGLLGTGKAGMEETIIEKGLENTPQQRILLNCTYILNFLYSSDNEVQRHFFAGGRSYKELLSELLGKRLPHMTPKTGLLVSYVEGGKALGWASDFTKKYSGGEENA